MKKVLFIGRDGTLIVEPEDQRVDSLQKLLFYPHVISSLHKIATELDYELVMVTNQAGLGSESFPDECFWEPHYKMINTLSNEEIVFSEVLIDQGYDVPENKNRKPEIGLVKHYMTGEYDLANSFIIGDSDVEVEFAKNLGAQAILLGTAPHKDAALTTTNWEEIYKFLKYPVRVGKVHRKTKETDILVEVNLDGSGKHSISTGLNFFDHMLEQVAQHSLCDIKIKAEGDLHIDEHHTIEDVALALGECFKSALGDKRGIDRYGFLLPMDDCLAQVALDFSGRNWLEWEVEFKRPMIGDYPTEMFFHFFKSFSDASKCNLNIKAEGGNEHHKIEAIFKALGKCIKQAVRRDPRNPAIPSTKGVI